MCDGVDSECTVVVVAAAAALPVAAAGGSCRRLAWRLFVTRRLVVAGLQWNRVREAVARGMCTAVHRESKALGTLWTRMWTRDQVSPLSVVWGRRNHQASRREALGRGPHDI